MPKLTGAAVRKKEIMMRNLSHVRESGMNEVKIARRLGETLQVVRGWFDGRARPTIRWHYDAIVGLAVEVAVRESAAVDVEDTEVVEQGRVTGLFEDGQHKSRYLLGKAVLELTGT